MKAVPGDQLIIDGDPSRSGEVIAVPRGDGSPPYVVRWMRSGHIALVSPDSYSSIIPAAGEQAGGMQAGGMQGGGMQAGGQQEPDGKRQ
jgi:Domain of unknown function (DUF1918)